MLVIRRLSYSGSSWKVGCAHARGTWIKDKVRPVPGGPQEDSRAERPGQGMSLRNDGAPHVFGHSRGLLQTWGKNS